MRALRWALFRLRQERCAARMELALGCSRCSVSFLGFADGIPHCCLRPGGGDGRDHWDRCVGIGAAAYAGY